MGKGALLVSPMPATAQEKSVDIIVLRSFSQMVVQGIDLIDYEDSMPTATGISKSLTEYEDSKYGKHSTNSATRMELFLYSSRTTCKVIMQKKMYSLI